MIASLCRSISLRPLLLPALLATLTLAGTGCKKASRVAQGNKDQIFHYGNGGEPADLDPQNVQGVPEHHIIKALFEGLVTMHPRDLSAQPGVAERWEVSPDGKTFTFALRANARWSDGQPVTADDFVQSYERILNPKFAAPYAENLYLMVGAEEYNKGKLTDFAQVGVKAPDKRKLQITLRAPAPFFIGMLRHYSWFPVPMATVTKFGKKYDKGNPWTRPENIVSNGPFTLKEWKPNDKLVVQKNPRYWDESSVQLKEIHFYPIESTDTEELAFRAGELHATNEVPASKTDAYRQAGTTLRIEPYYGVYYYRVNMDPQKGSNPALKKAEVRRALAMSIDREAIVKNVLRGGQLAAWSFVPPGPGGYQTRDKLKYDPEGARKLLAEAGYPGGKGVPKISILINTSEQHKAVAEAVQAMWKKELGIEVEINNQEWKVYLAAQNNMDYMVSRSGWIADYPDPNSFLNIHTTNNGNNNTGFANAKFDKLILDSWSAGASGKRTGMLQDAEGLLLADMPVVPIYFYTRRYLIQSSVKGWFPNMLDDHPWKYIYLDPAAPPDRLPVLGAAR